jgi:myo-inositol 2-dehydrogenase / D-chiro-inositol 1-dehydrogenase
VDKSGGGVLLDMGCHSIEYARWVFGKPAVKSVYASLGTYVHADKTRGEDHSLCIVEYEGGCVGVWPRTPGPSRAAWTTVRDLRLGRVHPGRPAPRLAC